MAFDLKADNAFDYATSTWHEQWDALPVWAVALIIVGGPIVCTLIVTALWACCCKGADRKGLSRSVLFEGYFCWPCMWADTASRVRALQTGNAWCHLIIMALLISSIIPVWWYLALTEDPATWKLWIYHMLRGFIALAWLIWTFERCSVRRFIKRMADPTFSSEGCCTLDDGVADCCSVCCCPVQAAMQEAQFVDNLEAGANPILLGLHGRQPRDKDGRDGLGRDTLQRAEEYKSSW